MGVTWSKTLYHNECDEYMQWNRHDETWKCPVCDFVIDDADAEDIG